MRAVLVVCQGDQSHQNAEAQSGSTHDSEEHGLCDVDLAGIDTCDLVNWTANRSVIVVPVAVERVTRDVRRLDALLASA